MSRIAFSAGVAFLLLAIYLIGIGDIMLDLVRHCREYGCPSPNERPAVSMPQGGIPETVLITIGSLISAVVVTALAITPPKEKVLAAQFAALDEGEPNYLILATNIYLIAWMVAGAAAFLLGTIIYPEVHKFLADLGQAWFGTAIVAAYAFFKISPPETRTRGGTTTSEADSDTLRELRKQIAAGKIVFDAAKQKEELLNQNSGTQATEALQKLVLALCGKTSETLRISSIIREKEFHAHDERVSRHAQGKAIDIGNEEIAASLLPAVATPGEVKRLGIDEIIFDATKAGQADGNKWNFDRGSPHKYDAATLQGHRDHIHFAVP